MRWLIPWSVSSGAQRSASANPAPSRARAARARAGAALFRDDVLKGGPGKYREKGVVQREKGKVAARIAAHGCADAADDHRKRERQEQERQEELTRTPGGGHGREQRPHGADA